MAYTRKVGTSKPTGVSDKYKNLRNKVLDCIEHPGSPNIVGLKKLLQNKYSELAQEILVKPSGSGPTRFLLTNFLNLLDIEPTRDCPVCGNFIYCNRLRFSQHCSKNCSAKDPLSKIKRSESYFEKTGKGKFVSFKGCSVPSRSELRDFFSIE
jgi:predicted nucleic acid-binding Zn ribbon protein